MFVYENSDDDPKFSLTNFRDLASMPSNVHITEEEIDSLESGGGLKERTISERKKSLHDYEEYVNAKLGLSVPEQFEADPEKLSKNFSKYFWSMVVTQTVNLSLQFIKIVNPSNLRKSLRMERQRRFHGDLSSTMPQS